MLASIRNSWLSVNIKWLPASEYIVRFLSYFWVHFLIFYSSKNKINDFLSGTSAQLPLFVHFKGQKKPIILLKLVVAKTIVLSWFLHASWKLAPVKSSPFTYYSLFKFFREGYSLIRSSSTWILCSEVFRILESFIDGNFWSRRSF